ncbi:MAG: sigma-54-dependent Fis family transcriptional regulator [Magnetococcales bacterium]|nr:sigma-54-dependent Fis family transcriptional regulator [Magnetococcales bacterium]MBF0149724.1 sigma-54-dependent Fis family transcriptional regulator [Magnetococcales bacterium]MBF0174535.1 sigma-54-dependent Fis family transcriptional regulator [Magnetococcales bacterium]MBF0347621.1 sigma-54-dependent Fis family transcriptional regulator [Magnetococcales bacterium]MBF0632806.1 sigma-54-dependent Fis family transcriptional regulator [Magnetococcales bacterium]
MYGIIGKAPRMQKLYKLIEKVASTHSTVLIHGESGTGKELIAKALHQLSPRADQPFIPVNCGAIPEDLLESELFGHVRGSFTGAANNRTGRFELANGGSLFLDEIGDMSPKLQVKMLRVLQEKMVDPVGAAKSIKVDVRVITATHKNLEVEVAQNRFREDLFYRLNVVPISVPPLRDRANDIPLLVEHFLKKCDATVPETFITDEIMEILKNYQWPGNVRELENLIERLTILADGQVKPEDLPDKIFNAVAVESQDDDDDERPVVPMTHFVHNPIVTEGIDFNTEVANFENNLILSALNSTGWNKNKAARLLNLNRTTLVEKIKKKGLEPAETES